jgi:hypothetical protein
MGFGYAASSVDLPTLGNPTRPVRQQLQLKTSSRFSPGRPALRSGGPIGWAWQSACAQPRVPPGYHKARCRHSLMMPRFPGRAPTCRAEPGGQAETVLAGTRVCPVRPRASCDLFAFIAEIHEGGHVVVHRQITSAPRPPSPRRSAAAMYFSVGRHGPVAAVSGCYVITALSTNPLLITITSGEKIGAEFSPYFIPYP